MKTGWTTLGAALFAAAFSIASNAVAQAASAPLTAAEVRKLDRDNRKITLRHDAIRELDMPAMTMVFQVRDPALLDAVKAGDKVRFRAERAQGSFWITALEPAR